MDIAKSRNFLLSEYGNIPISKPICYIIKNKEYQEVSLPQLNININSIYNFGGAEIIYDDNENEITVDNISIDEFIENGGNYRYIYWNLNQYYSFPKVNKIIIHKLVYHLNNIDIFSQTVNDSLSNIGNIDFFSELINNKDIKFITNLNNKYGFYLPYGVNLKTLKNEKSENIILSRNEQQKKESLAKNYTYHITTKEGYAVVKYIRYNTNLYYPKKLDGNIPNSYFSKVFLSADRNLSPNWIHISWDISKSPYPFRIEKGKQIPWEIISYKRLE